MSLLTEQEIREAHEKHSNEFLFEGTINFARAIEAKEINELPDLATPVLNRIKAETLEAFKVELMHLVANGEASISEISVAVDALEARIDKLTNKEKGEVK